VNRPYCEAADAAREHEKAPPSVERRHGTGRAFREAATARRFNPKMEPAGGGAFDQAGVSAGGAAAFFRGRLPRIDRLTDDLVHIAQE
jgi:hypothetical protein